MRRKLLVIGGGIGAITLGIAALGIIWYVRSGNLFEERLEALRASGAPVDLTCLEGELPAEQADLLGRLATAIDALPAVGSEEPFLTDLDRWTEADARKALERLRAFPEAFDLLARAADLPGFRIPFRPRREFADARGYVFQDSPWLQRMRKAGFILASRGAAEGLRGDDGVPWIVRALRACRWNDGGIFVHAMENTIATTALDGLRAAAARPGFDAAAARAAIEPRLAALDDPGRLGRSVEVERAWDIVLIRAVLDGEDVGLGPEFAGSTRTRPRSLVGSDGALLLRLLAREVERAHLPYPRVRPLLEEEAGKKPVPEAGETFGPLTARLLPRVPHAGSARSLARIRLARIALAALARKAAAGALPATLDDLAPDFPGGVPLDPWTGRPFLYDRDAAGATLASEATERAEEESGEEVRITWRLDGK